jgi:murein DD-endopeptidase MepM/ murein hydrolase activator NlpD
MAKIQYRFNPETLTFDIVAIPLKTRFAKGFVTFLVGFVIASVFMVIYGLFFDTPKSHNLRRQNADLRVKYDLLNKRFDETDRILTDLQERDNKVYRSIFELDIIPEQVREAGSSSSEKYASFSGYENSDILIGSSEKLEILIRKAYQQSKSFDQVAMLAKSKEKMMLCVPAINPVALKGRLRVMENFGGRIDPVYHRWAYHEGIDISGPTGTPIYATGDGVIDGTEYSFRGYGNQVLISHGFGYHTRYAHLSKVLVMPGQRVKRGEKIGLMGSTGKSTGSHLHYEVIVRGRPVNPLNYLSRDMDLDEYESIVDNAPKAKNAGKVVPKSKRRRR